MLKNNPKPLTIGELQEKYKMPKMTRDFVLEKIKGEKTGLEFEGSFTVKTLTLDEEATYLAEVDAWIFKATSGTPDAISSGVKEYIDIKTYLKYAVVNAPDWFWEFFNHPVDMNVWQSIYIEAFELKEKIQAVLLQNQKEALKNA